MPIQKATLSDAERASLLAHVQKHKVYPFKYRFRKTINGTTFLNADGSIGSYFTLTFTPGEILPVITLATAFIITPNTTVDIFSIGLSYKSSWTWADNGTPTTPDDEGSDIYHLLSNGGAINDFQVFYPTDWYLARQQPLYIHVYAGATTVTAGTSTMTGSVILGTLPTGN